MNFGGTIRVNKSGILIVVVLIFLLLLYTYKGKDEEEQILDIKSRKSISSDNTNIVSLTKLLIAAVDIAEKGGVEVVQVRQGGDRLVNLLGEQIKGKTKEGAKDRVTQGDFRSHRVMYYGMRRAFPKIKVISEEHTDNVDSGAYPIVSVENPEISDRIHTDEMVEAEDVAVWIDPLDATQEYTENLVEFVTTMVCVAVRGVPLIGVIHRPFSKETFWGGVGLGNSINLEELARKGRRRKSKKDKFHIIVSRSHTGKAQNYTTHVLDNEVDFDIIQAAGAGYKVLEVIEGKADIYLHVTIIKKWDLCAGNAILASLGGTMSTISGGKLDYSALSNPVNTKGILAYLNSPSIEDKLHRIQLSD